MKTHNNAHQPTPECGAAELKRYAFLITKMRFSILFAGLMVFYNVGTVRAETPIPNLKLIFSRDPVLCKEIDVLLEHDIGCRMHNNDNGTQRCGRRDRALSVNLNGTIKKVLEEVATNEYGYTEIFKATEVPPGPFKVIYVQEFKGDHHPRLVETWKVDAEALQQVLNLPPGPIKFEDREHKAAAHLKHINAAEFAKIIKTGEKLSDEWSPVINVHGDPYLLERKCEGRWVLGGYYQCNAVLALLIKEITENKPASIICRFENLPDNENKK